MTDTISTYRAEGWVDSNASLDYGRVRDYALAHFRALRRAGLLPIQREAQALRVAERAHGWGGEGLWQGKVEIARLGNWQWFAGLDAEEE